MACACLYVGIVFLSSKPGVRAVENRLNRTWGEPHKPAHLPESMRRLSVNRGAY